MGEIFFINIFYQWKAGFNSWCEDFVTQLSKGKRENKLATNFNEKKKNKKENS